MPSPSDKVPVEPVYVEPDVAHVACAKIGEPVGERVSPTFVGAGVGEFVGKCVGESVGN